MVSYHSAEEEILGRKKESRMEISSVTLNGSPSLKLQTLDLEQGSATIL